MSEYCIECDIKQYCDRNPAECPIAKQNKDIAEFEKAKQEFVAIFTEVFERIVGALANVINAFVNVFDDVITTLKPAIEIYSKPNSRIKHLALYAKKKRVRKKNLKRLLKGDK